MLRRRLKVLIILLFVFTLFTCIDPYSPVLTDYSKLLVVEGLITNEKGEYVIKLSSTIQDRNSVREKISDGEIYISDESGNIDRLTSFGEGIYKTDSSSFKGEIGKRYQLHIKTLDGSEYESDSCEMLPVPGIDSIYFGKDEKMLNNKTKLSHGISIYLDSKPVSDKNCFFKWDFQEDWKFKVPYPTVYKYISEYNVPPLSANEVNEFCYKNNNSSIILIADAQPGASIIIEHMPIQFIGTEESDRLTIRYTIMINQYSLSPKEYKFWSNLKKMNEIQGDIFGSQPFSVLSNIRNINKPDERVLGYFQVSSVDHRRIYIDYNEIASLELPYFNNDCRRIAKSPDDYPTGMGPPVTFDEIYSMHMSTPGYAFVEPVVNFQSGALLQLVFTSPECADCSLTGSAHKPDFWKDVE